MGFENLVGKPAYYCRQVTYRLKFENSEKDRKDKTIAASSRYSSTLVQIQTTSYDWGNGLRCNSRI